MAFALLVAKFYPQILSADWGVYLGIVETVQRALIPEYVDESFRGTAYGLYYLIVGFTFFISNVIVGAFWNSVGSSVAASYSIIFSIAGILALIVFIRKTM